MHQFTMSHVELAVRLNEGVYVKTKRAPHILKNEVEERRPLGNNARIMICDSWMVLKTIRHNVFISTAIAWIMV